MYHFQEHLKMLIQKPNTKPNISSIKQDVKKISISK